jgi:hypothetical protein
MCHGIAPFKPITRFWAQATMSFRVVIYQSAFKNGENKNPSLTAPEGNSKAVSSNEMLNETLNETLNGAFS